MLESLAANPLSVLQACPTQISPLETVTKHEKDNGQRIERIPMTVDELVRQRAALGSEQPMISYPKTATDYLDYPLYQLDIFAFRVAKLLAARIPPRSSSLETPAVIALLGPSDLDYLVMLLAVAKLGHTGLLLSTRLSNEAYVSLLERTGSHNLFVYNSYKGTAAELQNLVPGLQAAEILTEDVYNYPIPTGLHADTNLVSHLNPATESKHTSWIIHSSGSTGLPKPIFQTNGAAVKNYAHNMNMSGFITLPLYHNHGLSVLFRTIYSNKKLYLYSAKSPLTRQNLLDIMKSCELEIFYGVPYALKLLAETEEGLSVLSKFKAVMFGGSACPDSLGNLLVAHGVKLISHYGSYVFTERWHIYCFC